MSVSLVNPPQKENNTLIGHLERFEGKRKSAIDFEINIFDNFIVNNQDCKRLEEYNESGRRMLKNCNYNN